MAIATVSTRLRTWIDQLDERPGVYMLRSLDSGATYVGSARKSVRQRLRQNVIDLESGTHDVPLLQDDWNDFGGSRFAWSVSYAANSKEAQQQEIEWIKLAHALEDFGGYNRRTNISCIAASLRDTENKLSKNYRKERYCLLPSTNPHQRIAPGILKTFCQGNRPLAETKALTLDVDEETRLHLLHAWESSALRFNPASL